MRNKIIYLRLSDILIMFFFAVAFGGIVSGIFMLIFGTSFLYYWLFVSVAYFGVCLTNAFIESFQSKLSELKYNDFTSARGVIIGTFFNTTFYALAAEFDCKVNLDFEDENILILQLFNKAKSRDFKSAFILLKIKYNGFIFKIAIQSTRSYDEICKEREAILAYFQRYAKNNKNFIVTPLRFKGGR